MTDNEWNDVMNACRQIMNERQKKRKDVWRRSGARGMVSHVFAKAERAFALLMERSPDLAEAEAELVDVINYSAFCLIQLRNQNLNGEWPWVR
jgi:hypothetical protein